MKQLKEIEKEKGSNSTSLYSQRNGQSTMDLYNSPTYRALHPEQFTSESSDTSGSEEANDTETKTAE